MIEVVNKILKGGNWWVTVKVTSQYCGCMLSSRLLVFDHDPTEEEIKERL